MSASLSAGFMAQAACCWEASSRKVGNVHPGASFADTEFMDFVLSGAVLNWSFSTGTQPTTESEPHRSVGRSVYLAVTETKECVGSNTNLGIALLLQHGAKDDLNIRSAFWHMLGDAWVSLGVVLSGGAIMLTGWTVLDPLISLLVVGAILHGAWPLFKESLDVLLESTPPTISASQVVATIESMPGVKNVHDLHIWAVEPRLIMLTAHGTIPDAVAAMRRGVFGYLTKPFRVPQVLANLVHQKDIPVTLGLFITPGQRGDTYPASIGTGNASNRAQEYDAVNDTYARFLLDELIPELKKTYRITDDPDGRVIGGTSSGAICAFTVAWHRPEAFHKVISMIGSYVSIGYRPASDTAPAVSGGEIYPTWIRRAPPKPLRIFFQDGANDLSNQFGNWFLANQSMLSALEYANATADRTTPTAAITTHIGCRYVNASVVTVATACNGTSLPARVRSRTRLRSSMLRRSAASACTRTVQVLPNMLKLLTLRLPIAVCSAEKICGISTPRDSARSRSRSSRICGVDAL